MSQPADKPLSFAAALSQAESTAAAVDEVCRRAAAQLSAPPDLVLMFASPHHTADGDRLPIDVQRHLSARVVLGCSGESIIGHNREIERAPALSLWAACLPEVQVEPMHLQAVQTPDGLSFAGWSDRLPAAWPTESSLLVLADPFTFPAAEFLHRLNEDQPGIPVVGGMASGGGPGQNRLYLNGAALRQGAVAVWLHGRLRLRTVVSQGCRPIGRPWVVTKADHNLIQSLGGRPPLALLQEMYHDLPPAEQALLRQGLHLGCVTNEYQEQFQRGDFLVRNVIGVNPEDGAIAVADLVRTGQTVQFHVRDSHSADEDLRELLAATLESPQHQPQGALLFTCNGRGTRLFDVPDHDAAMVAQRTGGIPLAGFFAQGEIGPIGGKNHLHGFTASLALFGSP